MSKRIIQGLRNLTNIPCVACSCNLQPARGTPYATVVVVEEDESGHIVEIITALCDEHCPFCFLPTAAHLNPCSEEAHV